MQSDNNSFTCELLPARQPSRAADPCGLGSGRRELGSPLQTRGGCCSWQRGAPLCPKAGPFANSGRLRAPPGPPRLPNSALWPPARPPHPRLTAAGAGVHPPPGPRRRIPKPCPGGSGQPFVNPRGAAETHTPPSPGELLRRAASFSFFSSHPTLKNPCCKCNQRLDTIFHTLPVLVHYQIREGMLPGK